MLSLFPLPNIYITYMYIDQTIALGLLLLLLGALANYRNDPPETNPQFEQWKRRFGVSWTPEEELYRRKIFHQNMHIIQQHNADPTSTYAMGVNQFTVYTQTEFQARFLITTPAPPPTEVNETMVSAEDVDWTATGKVSRVKNQGHCGSCWAFSATGAMESFFLFRGQAVDLSEQQLVDCSRSMGNQGCSGGWAYYAMKYTIKYGLQTQDEYPYVAQNQKCKVQGGSWKINGTETMGIGCNVLSSKIYDHPIAVSVDGTNWSKYESGVFDDCDKGINHAVLLVGVVAQNWKIKNSWGTSWGEAGYIRLAPGNTCGLCEWAGAYPK